MRVFAVITWALVAMIWLGTGCSGDSDPTLPVNGGQNGNGEDKVFDDNEFYHLPVVEFAFLFDIKVKAAAEDNHDERQRHRP